MNNKRVRTKAMAMAVAAAMAVELCPVTAFAVTGDQVAADGTHSKTAHVSRTSEDDENEDIWSEYNVKVSITSAEGIITEAAVEADGDIEAGNRKYVKKLNTEIQNLKGKPATEASVNEINAVSGATRTSAAVKQAALEAMQSASEKQDPTPVEVNTAALQASITTAEGKNQADYTEASWATLTEKLTAAKAALEVCKAEKPILDGANASNYAEMVEVAKAAGAVLGVSGASLDELYDTTAAIEKLGYKELVLNTTGATIKETFANTVQVRRACLDKNPDRTCGYPSLVNLAKLAPADEAMQTALASLFVLKYGSIIVMDTMNYAEALPLYGLRQNVYTDPQKPMKVEPGIYPLNGGDENSVVLTTVDFALTYFVVSGELERSGVPCNLVINDAGGLSVLTSWAAGKFSSTSISKFIIENVEPKIKCRKLVIPGKVAVLKGDLEAKLPGWEIIVAPNEAVQLVKFLKDMKANGEI